MLGGGNGWLDRRMGLACDNLVAAEVVTADGRVLTASAESHPDLFWALHGGGGNFGVVTSLTLRLHPIGPVTVALLLWEPEEAGRVLRAYRDFVDAASDDVGGGSVFLTAPPEAFVPEDMAGAAGARHPARRRRARGGRPGGDRADARARAPGRDDRRDALRRAAVPARRPAGLPQLLVGRVSARAAGRGDRRLRRLGRRHDRALAVAARAVPGRRRGGARDRRLAGAVADRPLVRASVRPLVRPGRRRPRPAVGAATCGRRWRPGRPGRST